MRALEGRVAGRAILLHAGLVAMVGERLPDAARLDVAARGQLIQQVPRELGLMVEDLIVETGRIVAHDLSRRFGGTKAEDPGDLTGLGGDDLAHLGFRMHPGDIGMGPVENAPALAALSTGHE